MSTGIRRPGAGELGTRRLERLVEAAIVIAVVLIASASPSVAEVLVLEGSAMKYLANTSAPGGISGISWTAPGFNDAAWPAGAYGVGYETAIGAENLITTAVAPQTNSVYTRTWFFVSDPNAIATLFFGADWDDGVIAWINGVEVYRSAQMPAGTPTWNTAAALHESSNGASPNYGSLAEITATGVPAIHAGSNLLAVGVWNATLPSTDLVLVPRLETGLPPDVTRGPYLQNATPSSIVIRWRTGSPTSSEVRFGDAPGSLFSSESLAGSRTEHEIELTGLEPDRVYFYSVGFPGQLLAGGDSGHRFRTPPFPGTRRPSRIWVIGDAGTANANQQAVRDAYYNGPAAGLPTDLWLMLGDNAYQIGSDAEYQAGVFNMYADLLKTSTVWPTFGNHDAGSASSSGGGTGVYYNIFTLPESGEAGGLPTGTEAYYSFDFANIHFVCLNSEDVDRITGGIDPNGLMMTWLEQDLMATSQDWVIAFWHTPPYSKGTHNSDSTTDSGGRHFDVRETFLPVLDAWGVDLVLTGHSHVYERSFLLDGHYGVSSTLTGSMILDGGDGRVDGDGAYQKATAGPAPHEGSVYVVAGTSGQTSGGFPPLNHPAMVVGLDVLGSLVLDVEGDRLTAGFLNSTGQWQDHFTLVKNTGAAPAADFIASPLKGVAPLSVSFTDLSTTNTAEWSWDLDGDAIEDSVESDPVHVYAAPGTWPVTLTASNDGGSDVETKAGFVCAAPSAPPATSNLLFGPDWATLTWSAAPGAATWDVVRGDLFMLRFGGGSFTASVDACLADNTSSPTASDASIPPTLGAYFYLVRSNAPCDLAGTWDAGGAQGGPRDPGIAAAPAGCP